jgi:hypothetical protein
MFFFFFFFFFYSYRANIGLTLCTYICQMLSEKEDYLNLESDEGKGTLVQFYI